MRAIKREDLENNIYYQTPKWLFDLLLEGKITPGAYTTYVLMYDRTRLSAKNNWIDENGDVYIKYSYEELLSDLKLKSNTQIQRNLSKLIELNLIEKKRNFSSSTTYYLNIYSPTQNVVVIPTQSVSIIPTQIVETNKNNLNKNNLNKIEDNQSFNSDKVKFRKEFREYINIASKSTGLDIFRIEQVITPSLFRNIEISEVLKKISESKYLQGLEEEKPKIYHFTTKGCLDKMLVDFYATSEKKKEAPKEKETAVLSEENFEIMYNQYKDYGIEIFTGPKKKQFIKTCEVKGIQI